MAVISVKDISKIYKRSFSKPGMLNALKNFVSRKYENVIAIENVSFEIEEGETVALIGPNGAGKSTLIKILVGIIEPSSGQIRVAGYKPSIHNNEFKKNYAVILGKKNQLWWDIPPAETFLLLKDMYSINDSEYESTLNELSNILNVASILNRPVRTMSLGERMKCELIASLLHKPKILFLDEPTIGLDFVTQKKLRQFIKKYCKENKVTLVITSHYLPDIEELCERVIILKNGKKYFDGEIIELTKDINSYVHLHLTFENNVNYKDFENLGEISEVKENKIVITVQKEQLNQIFKRIKDESIIVDSKIESMTTIDLFEKMFKERGDQDDKSLL
ncbi:ATPase [Brevibacillus laterosporus]|uniref:ABC transporter ATP-binding protein n=1 Tax=Brevibacillus laterosporus TaxID=1465 RepID=UPI000C786FE2|nr:ATP-binding cassette domain-containing protein [Brevibacillus laterosporus]AUM64505.1 ATPase [Brevibacillus laterosporus]